MMHWISALFLIFTLWLPITNGQAAERVIQFSPEQQEQLVNQHNALRASIAAANMNKLEWSDGLAALAGDWASRCDAEHRPLTQRRNLGPFQFVGENIAWGSSDTLPDLDLVMQAWWSERSGYTYGNFPEECAPGQVCGHFTQMAWADSCSVGCAASICPTIQNGLDVNSGFVVVCNYGPGGNIVGETPWDRGDAAAACPSGSESGLCCQFHLLVQSFYSLLVIFTYLFSHLKFWVHS